jgi:hypothetical protein
VWYAFCQRGWSTEQFEAPPRPNGAADREPRPKCDSLATTKLTELPPEKFKQKFAAIYSSKLPFALVARLVLLPPVQTIHTTAAGTLRDRTKPSLFTNEITEMSPIEWAVSEILRRKYPKIHQEILVAACEHAGYIEPGSDPDFPDPPSVLPETFEESAGNEDAEHLQ